MSALTKLFVVLLVICSLLLTAALVVFVNQQHSFLTSIKAHQDRITQLQRDKVNMAQEVDQAKSETARITAAAAAAAKAAQDEIRTLTEKAASSDVDNRKLTARIAVLDASVADLTNTVKLTQQALGDLQKRYDAIMADADKLRTSNAELAGANTDQQKRLDVLERERRILVEQITQLKKDNEMARNLLAEHNLSLDARAGKKVPAPSLKGVITALRPTSDGITYASISLGSADRVEKGMQFYVINQNTNEFLGKLTVDAVEPRESFGRLEGPRIADIKPDCQVLTQL